MAGIPMNLWLWLQGTETAVPAAVIRAKHSPPSPLPLQPVLPWAGPALLPQPRVGVPNVLIPSCSVWNPTCLLGRVSHATVGI